MLWDMIYVIKFFYYENFHDPWNEIKWLLYYAFADYVSQLTLFTYGFPLYT